MIRRRGVWLNTCILEESKSYEKSIGLRAGGFIGGHLVKKLKREG
jgi:hypothetical protein